MDRKRRHFTYMSKYSLGNQQAHVNGHMPVFAREEEFGSPLMRE